MYRIVAFALIAAVSCNDLIQGPEVGREGRQIYNDTKEANPAIWKQMEEVTIKANDTDVISRIVITDLRPNKDGEVKIIEGGQGQKNVTVELKSPTVFRGYSFHIEVYVVNENGQDIDFPEEMSTTEVPAFTEQIPVMENDTKVNAKDEDSVASTESNESLTEDNTEVRKDKVEAPVNTGRKSTDAKVDAIVQYVSENITEKDSQEDSHPSIDISNSEGTQKANITPTYDAGVAFSHPHLVPKNEEFNKGH